MAGYSNRATLDLSWARDFIWNLDGIGTRNGAYGESDYDKLFRMGVLTSMLGLD